MFWLFDTCQNKVSADQQHVTISRAQIDLIEVSCFFFKLTADQGLVVDWIAVSSYVRHLSINDKRGLIFRALSVARRGYTTMLRHQKLKEERGSWERGWTVDSFRVQVENGLENISFLYFSLVSIQV